MHGAAMFQRLHVDAIDSVTSVNVTSKRAHTHTHKERLRQTGGVPPAVLRGQTAGLTAADGFAGGGRGDSRSSDGDLRIIGTTATSHNACAEAVTRDTVLD